VLNYCVSLLVKSLSLYDSEVKKDMVKAIDVEQLLKVIDLVEFNRILKDTVAK
jgi:hypothetical protein